MVAGLAPLEPASALVAMKFSNSELGIEMGSMLGMSPPIEAKSRPESVDSQFSISAKSCSRTLEISSGKPLGFLPSFTGLPALAELPRLSLLRASVGGCWPFVAAGVGLGIIFDVSNGSEITGDPVVVVVVPDAPTDCLIVDEMGPAFWSPEVAPLFALKSISDKSFKVLDETPDGLAAPDEGDVEVVVAVVVVVVAEVAVTDKAERSAEGVLFAFLTRRSYLVKMLFKSSFKRNNSMVRSSFATRSMRSTIRSFI